MRDPIPHRIPIGHGLEGEPHLRQRAFRKDPSEERAAEVLAGEEGRGDPTGHLAEQSVHEEVHTLYTVTGETEGGWSAWYQERRARTRASESWGIVLFCALLSGPLALVGSLFPHGDLPSEWGAFGAAVLFGPAIEEVLKVALLAILIETRSYLIRGPFQIRLVAYASALVFATVENVIYLELYLDAPSEAIAAWRMGVCTALHLIATAIAAEGLVRAWRRSTQSGSRPALDGAFAWLAAAIALHATYNLVAFGLEAAGFVS